MLSELFQRAATWSVKSATAITNRKAVVLSTDIETVALAGARATNVMGLSNVPYDESVAGQAFGVLGHDGDILEYTASGAVTQYDKLCVVGAAGNLGTARIGDEYIGIALETIADGENGRMLFCRGIRRGDLPVISGALAAKGSIAGVFPAAGTYEVHLTIVNTTANAVTGGVNVGTTENGTDIASGTTVGASATIKITTAIKVAAAAALYVDAASSWNSASLTIYPRLIKLA